MVALQVNTQTCAAWALRFTEASRDFLTTAANPRFLVGRLALFVALGGLIVESLLAARLWAQLTSQSPNGFLLGLLFDVTGFLVSPFREAEASPSIKTTGILDFATLVALEAYLVAALAGLALLFVGPRLVLPEAPPRPHTTAAPEGEQARPRPARTRPAHATTKRY